MTNYSVRVREAWFGNLVRERELGLYLFSSTKSFTLVIGSQYLLLLARGPPRSLCQP